MQWLTWDTFSNPAPTAHDTPPTTHHLFRCPISTFSELSENSTTLTFDQFAPSFSALFSGIHGSVTERKEKVCIVESLEASSCQFHLLHYLDPIVFSLSTLNCKQIDCRQAGGCACSATFSLEYCCFPPPSYLAHHSLWTPCTRADVLHVPLYFGFILQQVNRKSLEFIDLLSLLGYARTYVRFRHSIN